MILRTCRAGQLALAWLLAQGEDVVPIPGTKRVKYLEENLGAAHIQLTPEEVKTLSDIADPSKVRWEMESGRIEWSLSSAHGLRVWWSKGFVGAPCIVRRVCGCFQAFHAHTPRCTKSAPMLRNPNTSVPCHPGNRSRERGTTKARRRFVAGGRGVTRLMGCACLKSDGVGWRVSLALAACPWPNRKFPLLICSTRTKLMLRTSRVTFRE